MNINVQQPELITRELLDSLIQRFLRSFLLQFMKLYLIVNVHDDFPVPVYCVVQCNLDLLNVCFCSDLMRWIWCGVLSCSK